MSDVRALDRLGAQMGAALERELPAIRRRRRVAWVAGALALAVAVPAAGTATEWAGLAGGETPLPTQVRDDLRAVLASGRDGRGRWRLEAYRAEIGTRGGEVGLCIFASRRDGGSGRCVPERSVGDLTVAAAGDGWLSGMASGVVSDRVARVEVTLRRYDRTGRLLVVAVGPAEVPAQVVADRGLPDGLRTFVVLLHTSSPLEAVGVRALDVGGRTVATHGRPARPARSLASRPSPVTTQETRP